jgi:hypothetical protein
MEEKGGKAVCAKGMVVVVVVETVGRSRSGAVDKTIGARGTTHIDKNICHPNGQNISEAAKEEYKD